MKDDEIIKTLTCCDSDSVASCCIKCQLHDRGDCVHILSHNALDLINRQKAEIERLEKELELARADKVIAEKHEKDARDLFKDIVIQLKTAKSKAIKEFVERLKNEIINDTAYGIEWRQYIGYYDYTIKIGDIPKYIDGIVKEMTEVQE